MSDLVSELTKRLKSSIQTLEMKTYSDLQKSSRKKPYYHKDYKVFDYLGWRFQYFVQQAQMDKVIAGGEQHKDTDTD